MNGLTQFLAADPFPHLVIDDFMPADVLAKCGAEFDEVPHGSWLRYSGEDERGKAAFNDMGNMPQHCRSVLTVLTHPSAARFCEKLCGIDCLESDPSLYGGGLHATEAGGFLGIHIDNERHPATGNARRLNLIVYCTEGWREEWGGHLEFWDRTRTKPVVKIAPMFNRAVLFETGQRSYHGHTAPLKCPEGVTRKSLAVYYWSPVRSRARFFGSPDEPFNQSRESGRLARSGIVSTQFSGNAKSDTISL